MMHDFFSSEKVQLLQIQFFRVTFLTHNIQNAVLCGIFFHILPSLGAKLTEQNIVLDPLSGSSLYITQLCNGNPIGTATRFVVASEGTNFLITNWHVVTGKHPDTFRLIASHKPDAINVIHHGKTIGNWIESTIELYDRSGNHH